MKKLLLTILFLSQLLSGFSQKEDAFWTFGYSSNTVDSSFGGTNIDFNSDPPEIQYEFRELDFHITNSSICDSEGNLLFYTNGLSIANSSGEILENGEGLNPDPYREDWIDRGYTLYQGTLILPLPDSPNLYYLFHEERSRAPDDPVHNTKVFTLYYSIIDMSANNGAGKVIEKNIPMIQDTLDYGKITATKHSNGEDWWLLIPEFDSNKYYRILFTQNGIFSIDTQTVGEMVFAGAGQTVFSPDGNKYVRYILRDINVGNFLNIYDFDRCTGLLSNPEQYNIVDQAYSGGVAISPNSRFLYVSSFEYTYQYDLEATDIEASKDTVAIYDGFVDIAFFTNFFLAQLGPDGKIYINSNGTVRYLHIIHNPNAPGVACNFEQHAIELPTWNRSSMPNFPNYRLGPAPASDTCQLVTTTITPPISESMVELFPNPVYDIITISTESEERYMVLDVYNELGQKVLSKSVSPFYGEAEIDIHHLDSGIYFWSVKDQKNQRLGMGKIIKLDR